MKLLTKELWNKLRDAGHENMNPIVKFFNPMGAATWLITELEEDGDTMWGYADLGMGCVEYGTISLNELAAVELPGGLRIERDLHFKGTDKTPEQILNLDSLTGF